MTIKEKLALRDEIEKRNEERIKAYMQTAGVHTALEIHAKSIIDSLDILAERYMLPREELLDALNDTLRATHQHMAQQEIVAKVRETVPDFDKKAEEIFFGKAEAEGVKNHVEHVHP